MKRYFLLGLFAVFSMTLACRPVLAIGWEEVLLLAGLVIFLLGPPFYRFIQRIAGLRRRDRTKRG